MAKLFFPLALALSSEPLNSICIVLTVNSWALGFRVSTLLLELLFCSTYTHTSLYLTSRPVAAVSLHLHQMQYKYLDDHDAASRATWKYSSLLCDIFTFTHQMYLHTRSSTIVPSKTTLNEDDAFFFISCRRILFWWNHAPLTRGNTRSKCFFLFYQLNSSRM